MSRRRFPHPVSGQEDYPLTAGKEAWFRLGGDWSDEDCAKPNSGLRAVLFGFVVRLVVRVAQIAEPGMVCGHYPSDLWHDATALGLMTVEDLRKGLFLAADNWGTWLFPADMPEPPTRAWCWRLQVIRHVPYPDARHHEWFLHVQCTRSPEVPKGHGLPDWMKGLVTS
jgi:hypothetical protein